MIQIFVGEWRAASLNSRFDQYEECYITVVGFFYVYLKLSMTSESLFKTYKSQTFSSVVGRFFSLV